MNREIFFFRLLVITISIVLGLHIFLVAFNSIVDPTTRFDMLSGMLAMKDTAANTHYMWRSIDADYVIWFFYILVVIIVLVSSVLLLFAGINLLIHILKDSDEWSACKYSVYFGIFLIVLVQMLFYQVMVGEWFYGWQSAIWGNFFNSDIIMESFALVILTRLAR